MVKWLNELKISKGSGETFTRGILKAKRHNILLIISKGSGESSFILISFTNLDLSKPRFHVEFKKYDNIT